MKMKLTQTLSQASRCRLVLLFGVMALAPGAISQNSTQLGYYRLLQVKPDTMATMLVALANTSRYMMIQRLRGADFLNATSVVDLSTNTSRTFQPTADHFCAGVAITKEGNILLMGGHSGMNGIPTGIQRITLFNRTSENFTYLNRMTRPRWYTTPIRIDDNKILIAGGSNKIDSGTGSPDAEIWNGSSPLTIPKSFPQPTTFMAAGNQTWFPFMAMLPKGHLLWWSNTGGSITDLNGTLIMDLPPLPDRVKSHRTMYPNTATMTMLAYDPATGYKPTFVIFGGSLANTTVITNASSSVLRLDLEPCANDTNGIYCPRGWELDNMLGIGRTMGDSVLLPNGKVMVVNGAQVGLAKYSNLVSIAIDPSRTTYNGRSHYPNTVALQYNPTATLGQRFKKLAPTNIIRMYHGTACLHHTGEVLIAGCDTCAPGFRGAPTDWSPSPDGSVEKRLQLVVTPELASGLPRPVILSAPATIRRGQTFTVTFNATTVAGASLSSPCASTHSINMNSRVVFLRVVNATSDSTVLEAPPANLPSLSPAGWYILFLLSPDGVYSEGTWVTLS